MRQTVRQTRFSPRNSDPPGEIQAENIISYNQNFTYQRGGGGSLQMKMITGIRCHGPRFLFLQFTIFYFYNFTKIFEQSIEI